MAAAGELMRGDVGVVAADATQDLYGRYGRQIYAFCLKELRSPEEAEDAVQTTFLNAFRGFQRGTITHAEQAWLYKIAANVCIERRSSSARRLRLEYPNDFEILQETVASPHGGGAADELIGIEEALESMPENQRRAILLREWQGLSYREIADELGVTQTAVEMLIFRARRTLASALEQPEKPEKKRRVARGLNLGSLLGAAKSLLAGGGVAAKVAAAVAVVSAGTIAVGTPAQHTIVRAHKPAAPVRALPATASILSIAPPRPLLVQSARPFAPQQAVAPPSVHHARVHDVSGRKAAPLAAEPAPIEPSPPSAAAVPPAPEPQPAPPPPAPSASPPPAPTAPAPPKKDKEKDPAPAQTPAPTPVQQDTGATTASPQPAAAPSGQAKKDKSGDLPPGQAKKVDATPPVAPTPAPAPPSVTAPQTPLVAVPVAAAQALPPGQAKKQQDSLAPTTAVPAAAELAKGHGKGHDK